MCRVFVLLRKGALPKEGAKTQSIVYPIKKAVSVRKITTWLKRDRKVLDLKPEVFGYFFAVFKGCCYCEFCVFYPCMIAANPGRTGGKK